MTIRGINDFHGEVQVSFTIAQPEKPVTPTDNMWDTHNIENLDVRLANQLVANGKNQEQKIVISCSKDKTTLKEGVDYKLTNNSVTKAGNYTLTAKGINNYHGTIKVNFTVQQAAKTDIRNAKVTLANTLKEDGKNQTQKVKITYGDLILEEGVDYTLENNVAKNAGTYTMKIKAMGDLFTGETTAKFTIAAKEDKKEEKKEDKQENVEQAVEENNNGMVLGIAAIAVAALAGIIAFLKKHAK
ncbi:MAG: hypothetical protein KBT48_02445 [Firmicutes bacterium]|nr:hypothetical protein [Bacillota bacterium]